MSTSGTLHNATHGSAALADARWPGTQPDHHTPQSRLSVQVVASEEDLLRLRSRWNDLTQGVPFRSWQWLHTWWKHYGTHLRLFVMAVWEGTEFIGLAPWCLEDSPWRGRVIRFLGSGEVCSEYLTVLCRPEHEESVAAAVAHCLQDSAWDLLHLQSVAAKDRVVAKVVAHLVDAGAQVHQRPGLNCWRIALPHTWDDYLATLSKSHRKQLRRTERNVFETGRARFRTAASDHELATALCWLRDLHQRRRTSLGEPGCFADNRFHGFLQECVPQLHAAHGCEIHWVELDGRPVTAELHLQGDGIVYAYQAGIDPTVLDEEPGRLITLAALQRAIRRGGTAYDFCRGDEPYKAHWRATPHPMLEVRVVPGRSLPRVRHGLWLAGQAVKDALQRWRRQLTSRRFSRSQSVSRATCSDTLSPKASRPNSVTNTRASSSEASSSALKGQRVPQ